MIFLPHCDHTSACEREVNAVIIVFIVADEREKAS